MYNQEIVIITGATASGKSQFAIDFAMKNDGIIINSDSIQIYKEIPILSAQPHKEDMQNIEHLMYGYINYYENYSVGRFLNDLKINIQYVIEKNKLPIIVGGTHMYINAILHGISNIPIIDNEIQNKIQKLLQENDINYLYSILQNIDSEYAKMININDKQRIMRGLEVKMQTGKSILDFWNNKDNNVNYFKDFKIKTIIIDKSREEIYQNCNIRFDKMIQNNVIEEIRNLMHQMVCNNQNFTKMPSIFKASGMKEIVSYLNNEISLDIVIEKSKQSTRNYAKRQLTWLRKLKKYI